MVVFIFSAFDALVNMTMINKLFGVDYVDGAYWTLTYELVFYFWFFCMLAIPTIRITVLFSFLLFMSLLSILGLVDTNIYIVWGGDFIAYFIAGAMFYQIFNGKASLDVYLTLLASVAVTFFQLKLQVDKKNFNPNVDLDIIPPYLIVSLFYLFFTCLALGYFNSFRWRFSYLLGMLTYPCYLLHQNIAYIIFNSVAYDINKFYLLFFVILFVLFLSFIVAQYFEKPIANKVKSVARGSFSHG